MERLKVLIANPRGFCAGVARAVDTVETAIELYGAPVYVRGEIVHNRAVIESCEALGAVFVRELDEAPTGAVVIFSAHGVSPQVRALAAARRQVVVDATCPLVTKVHLEAIRFAREGRTVILVGHAGHEEVVGITGEIPDRIRLVSNVDDALRVAVPHPERVAAITQTTLSVDDTCEILQVLQARFPRLQTPRRDDICYATQNRQSAVRLMAEACQLVLVLGSARSSNSNRLREVAARTGVRAELVEDAGQIQLDWLSGVSTLALTAGASTPERLVQGAVAFLRTVRDVSVQELQAGTERVVFSRPMGLVQLRCAG
jgi:4-hydroxy-3-methylbut-2-en-1-yl diphosphate reductase